MNLYLIRHGEAESKSEKLNDAERRLTKAGSDIVHTSVRLWKNLVTSIDIIVSSPLVRAVQTAEIIRDEFNIEEKIITDKSLLNGGNIKDILTLVQSFEKDNIAIVGHQPDLSEHISKLISSSEIHLNLAPATIVKISSDKSFSKGKGLLEFFIPPVRTSRG